MSNTTLPAPTDQNRALTRQEPSAQEMTRQQEQWVAPPVDIYETEEGLTVIADLPGVSKDNLDIEVKNDLLTLQAKAQAAMPGEPIYQEFQLGQFFRQFRLADTVDTNHIQAELKHGVLTLHLPKSEEARPRKIEVQVV
ncbi:MAG TPA: Hsp20/alpha crystallin family protein [Chthonomonadaceae bacterium]|nr:Hsp20/alpha crystallin family protein [Chthonomonadaceae bacterium]